MGVSLLRAGSITLLVSAAALVVSAHRPAAEMAAPDGPAVVHVLNRLGFGPRPGDVARVQRVGIAAYIEAQLNPGSIPDESVAARVSPFGTLRMSTRQLADEYYIPALQQRRARQRAAAPSGEAPGMPPMMAEPAAKDSTSEARRERLVLLELSQHKILRASYSERQLEEVMVDFWFNHFNVFAGKGQTRIYVTEYERDAIRPRVFGRFRDLLGAVAESPAMLFYLDNWQSAAPEGAETMTGRRRPVAGTRAAAAPNRRRGLNENYARELMELHTLGVDGGYTQKDVQEVARAFTGWTIDLPRQGGTFRFDPRLHDAGEKIVLGRRIPAGGGKQDGEVVLDLLARHPSTARFIAAKLARRFVADNPPKALVDRAAARFLETDGDIRAVVRTIVTAPEFSAPAAYRAKLKTPLEFVASAVRASDVDVRNAQPLVLAMRQLGMPLYMCQPPTGYADRADAWVNTGTLLNRMNFAVALATNRTWTGEGEPARSERVASEILAGQVSSTTRATVGKASNDRQALALLLGSPDFQKR